MPHGCVCGDRPTTRVVHGDSQSMLVAPHGYFNVPGPASLISGSDPIRHMNGGGQSAAKRTIVAAATFTAEPIADAVRFWAAELDLPIDIRFAGYSQVFQELLDPSSLMSRNSSGLNVVALRLEDWGQRTNAPGRSEDPRQ